MFHSNSKLFRSVLAALVLMAGLFASSMSFAQDETSVEALPKTARFSTISLEYLSWKELMDINNGTQQDKAFADFFGNALTYEREIYNSVRSGLALSGSFMFGKANGGGTQTTLTYQTSQQSWMGVMGSARFAYRMTPTVTASIGPMLLYRHMSWPDQGTGYSIKSGQDANLGLLGELGLRINPHWEVRMEMGTLAIRATTFWSVGLGYKF